MLIKFIINGCEQTYDIDINETLLEIKNKIICDHFNNQSTGLTFTFIGDKPIREFGKYNLIPDQEIPGTLDYLKISNFSEIDRNYKFKVHKIKAEAVKKTKYIPRNKKFETQNVKETINEFCLNLTEFPPLS